MTTEATDAASPKMKTAYRVQNWGEYEATLVQSASLALWVDEVALAKLVRAAAHGPTQCVAHLHGGSHPVRADCAGAVPARCARSRGCCARS